MNKLILQCDSFGIEEMAKVNGFERAFDFLCELSNTITVEHHIVIYGVTYIDTYAYGGFANSKTVEGEDQHIIDL